jgi:hypothetical protein
LDPSEAHDYRIVRYGTGKAGNVLLRCRAGTLSHFGLCAFPRVATAYTRNGGIHIGKWRTSPRKVNWQSFRIAVPERYPSGVGWKGWSFALSANHRLYDFEAVAQAIEASGVPWIGFQKQSGARYLDRSALINGSPPVKP